MSVSSSLDSSKIEVDLQDEKLACLLMQLEHILVFTSGRVSMRAWRSGVRACERACRHVSVHAGV
jgi:hypothetical protein